MQDKKQKVPEEKDDNWIGELIAQTELYLLYRFLILIIILINFFRYLHDYAYRIFLRWNGELRSTLDFERGRNERQGLKSFALGVRVHNHYTSCKS